jgi:hypothetical protein
MSFMQDSKPPDTEVAPETRIKAATYKVGPLVYDADLNIHWFENVLVSVQNGLYLF